MTDREIIEMFNEKRIQDKKDRKEKKLEKALYGWLNTTEKVETAVCKLLDGEIDKEKLIKINASIKRKFRDLEKMIKEY